MVLLYDIIIIQVFSCCLAPPPSLSTFQEQGYRRHRLTWDGRCSWPLSGRTSATDSRRRGCRWDSSFGKQTSAWWPSCSSRRRPSPSPCPRSPPALAAAAAAVPSCSVEAADSSRRHLTSPTDEGAKQTGLAVGTETSLKARDEGRKESRVALLLPRIPSEQLRRFRDCRRWIIYRRGEERGELGRGWEASTTR